MKRLQISLPYQELWYEMNVRQETFDHYKHLHRNLTESDPDIIAEILAFDAGTNEPEKPMEERLSAAKELAKSLFE